MDPGFGELAVILQDHAVCHIKVKETMKPEKFANGQLTVL